MNYKKLLLNINFYILSIISISGILIQNNIFYLCILFFILINIKDYFSKIISFNFNDSLMFILTTIINSIEIFHFNTNYSLLILLFIFKKHEKNNFAYLNYYMNKINIEDDSFDFIFSKGNLNHKLYFNDYILLISPCFSGLVFNGQQYNLDILNNYVNLSGKKLSALTTKDFELISVLDY